MTQPPSPNEPARQPLAYQRLPSHHDHHAPVLPFQHPAPTHQHVGPPAPQAPPGTTIPPGLMPLPPLRGSAPPSRKRPSGWNGPAYGMLAIALICIGVLVWPQLRARKTEAAVRPLVSALSQRDAGARCPRYITSVLTNVGSVRFNEHGTIADHTDLTGPVCDALRHLYATGGNAELQCLSTDQPPCTESALRSVIAISVVAHESMHLRGQLDETLAECESIGESQTIASTLGIPLDQARMISWLHYASMNPNTPPQYRVSPESCAPVADLLRSPPGTEQARQTLQPKLAQAWQSLAT